VTPAERARVPHHGLDLVDPDVRFTVADFVRHARPVLAGIAAAGGLAVVVGGTGLYLRAVAAGLDPDALPSDAVVRARIEQALETDGLAALVARLEALAPAAAARIDRANPRRVVRALEIAELAGDAPPPPLGGYGGRVGRLGLDTDLETHAGWIAARARAQFDAGLLDEARALRERWDPGLPAFSAIGYHEAWAALDGVIDLDMAIGRDIQRNVAFAKRQRTWFRSEPAVAWLDPAHDDPLPAALALARDVVGGR
jgi:tRNA dimethylallyltransferase